LPFFHFSPITSRWKPNPGSEMVSYCFIILSDGRSPRTVSNVVTDGFSWLKIGTIGGLLWMRRWTFGFWRQGVSSYLWRTIVTDLRTSTTAIFCNIAERKKWQCLLSLGVFLREIASLYVLICCEWTYTELKFVFSIRIALIHYSVTSPVCLDERSLRTQGIKVEWRIEECCSGVMSTSNERLFINQADTSTGVYFEGGRVLRKVDVVLPVTNFKCFKEWS
jgi:hypothetical protein